MDAEAQRATNTMHPLSKSVKGGPDMLTSQSYAISTSELNSPTSSSNLDGLILALEDAYFDAVLDAWDEEDRESVHSEAL